MWGIIDSRHTVIYQTNNNVILENVIRSKKNVTYKKAAKKLWKKLQRNLGQNDLMYQPGPQLELYQSAFASQQSNHSLRSLQHSNNNSEEQCLKIKYTMKAKMVNTWIGFCKQVNHLDK